MKLPELLPELLPDLLLLLLLLANTCRRSLRTDAAPPACPACSPSAAAGDTDPRSAMLLAVQQQQRLGVRVVFEGSNVDDLEDDEELEDVLEDLEDPWMRHPSRELPSAGGSRRACARLGGC